MPVTPAARSARFALLALAGLALAEPTLAAGAAKKDSDVARSMSADLIVTPVVREGKLVNYLFVSVKYELAETKDVFKLLERQHFLRDALLRATHRTDLSDPKDVNALNQEAALAAFKAAGEEALGPKAIGAVEITAVRSLRRPT